ncbi:MAG: hypothetical protein OEO77_13400, partial [Acidimicrobiia bacterium]|nr:hypothetical protein [Acidimicrobiia bacterium]
WINPARDIGIRYLIVNKSLRDNKGVGAEYLPNVEAYIAPALERQAEKGIVELRFENATYALYELIDRPTTQRETLLIDSSWREYLDLVYDRLDLSRCYDFEYLPYYEPDNQTEGTVRLYAPDSASAALDLYALQHAGSFFPPSSKSFAFNSNIATSSYYQSPMFRLFLFFSNTKWNRTEVITPGLFGTLRGSFVAAPRATRITVPVTVERPGSYRVLLRGAPTANQIQISAPSLGYEHSAEVRSTPDSLQYFTQETVYTAKRVAVDTGHLSVGQLEDRIGTDLVPMNVRYAYVDLGLVQAVPGVHAFTIEKSDNNPILLEGLVLVPSDEFDSLSLPDNFAAVDDPNELRCGNRYQVFDSRDVNYVDPAENAEHENLSNEELLSLAAAGVSGLKADHGEGLRYDWVVLALTGVLLAGAAISVRAHTRPRDDEARPAQDRSERPNT